ncbi:hypothetical protein QF019_003109 [Pseudomonas frederiksbergensis]
MDDDLIDDAGFELGMPSHSQLLKHQCDLLCAELETTRRDLRKAHKDIAGLIVMYRDSEFIERRFSWTAFHCEVLRSNSQWLDSM